MKHTHRLFCFVALPLTTTFQIVLVLLFDKLLSKSCFYQVVLEKLHKIWLSQTLDFTEPTLIWLSANTYLSASELVQKHWSASVRTRTHTHTHSAHIHPHTSCHWANWAIKRPFWPMSLAIEQLSPPHSLLSSDWFMCACLQEQDLWFPTVPRIIYNTHSTPEFMPRTPRRSISWSWSPTNYVREYESLHP